ncbi:TetR/AcrR family transcriptional regulator [Nocardia sp. NBC_00508]|uniref:TetR/AcrR family transcriptional regulator n=1 Tax=Nocardia sp. NBC_00508 TaxID=2975992 RepID=UPI002E8098BC|nr:TetR/AcrR family transcriptional regulator [Nocardia sp. NBC_00508]WUD67682.1 TetR/AcrR family transcriptional regulator [Nocardia sp. NBC_00508]
MRCVICRSELAQPTRGRRRRYCSRSCQARAYRARRSSAPVRRATRPIRLTEVGIARVAVELADRDGIDGLTMRRLASALGVATAGLYRHFPDREALLAGMAELVLNEIPPPEPHCRGWRPRLRHEAHEEWRLYREHPWMLPLLARTRPPLGPALLDILERNFAALDRAGLDRRTVSTIYLALSGLVQGLALLWSSERVDRLGDPRDAAGETALRHDLAELLDPAVRPALHRYFGDEDSDFAMDFDDLLATAVELLLDGVAVRHLESTE